MTANWAACSLRTMAGSTGLQKSSGLGGRDVFTLEQASNWHVACRHQQRHFHAGCQCQANGSPINTVVNEKVSTPRRVKKGKKKTSVATKTLVQFRAGCQGDRHSGLRRSVVRGDQFWIVHQH